MEMEDAASCWGRDHDEIFKMLCLRILNNVYGEECCSIIYNAIEKGAQSIDQLREDSKLEENTFNRSISTLLHSKIIRTEPFSIDYTQMFNLLLYSHFLEFAMSCSPIPQDKELIAYIIQKVFDEQTLNSQKLANSLVTKHADLDRNRIVYLIEHLVGKQVLQEDSEGCISFNVPFYYMEKRKEAIKSMVQYNDHRVVEVVDALFSKDLFFKILSDKENTKFDVDEVVNKLMDITGLTEKEINGIFKILKAKEYSLISQNEWILTPNETLKNFKIKQIANILVEIGYPLSRRVVNILLKNEHLETTMLCELCLLSSEDGQELFEKLMFLGILMVDKLQDAPHTSLKKHYYVWRINFPVAIANSSAYLLGILTKLYIDLSNEISLSNEKYSLSESLLQMHKKTLNDRIKIINNTIMSVSRKYIEVHEL